MDRTQTRTKSRSLAQIQIEGQSWSVRASGHAIDRMAQRGVDAFAVTGTVIALGPERLQELKEQEAESIIIDQVRDIAVVIGFKGNRIMVVTVIDKSNVFVKSNTTIERIAVAA